MNNLIGISGKMGSGKDLLELMLQYFNWRETIISKGVVSEDWLRPFSSDFKTENVNKKIVYENKKFAGILKDITCMLIGCTRKQLEDRVFKEKPLGEQWNCWLEHHTQGTANIRLYRPEKILENYDEYRIMTPRLLLQLLGTEAGRQIIHPNIWVNALFNTYNSSKKWIVTDVRFPNEADIIKSKGGIVIRIDRPSIELVNKTSLHPSETALDNYKSFDHTFMNDGTIPELYNKVSKWIQ